MCHCSSRCRCYRALCCCFLSIVLLTFDFEFEREELDFTSKNTCWPNRIEHPSLQYTHTYYNYLYCLYPLSGWSVRICSIFTFSWVSSTCNSILRDGNYFQLLFFLHKFSIIELIWNKSLQEWLVLYPTSSLQNTVSNIIFTQKGKGNYSLYAFFVVQ